mmetsp:Transcript_26686/g.71682  ORF Transcript_26686/g.71682 Transcript_26686/m.71682 type:complete len:305 (-) Transcript_26686:35-949(-)
MASKKRVSLARIVSGTGGAGGSEDTFFTSSGNTLRWTSCLGTRWTSVTTPIAKFGRCGSGVAGAPARAIGVGAEVAIAPAGTGAGTDNGAGAGAGPVFGDSPARAKGLPARGPCWAALPGDPASIMSRSSASITEGSCFTSATAVRSCSCSDRCCCCGDGCATRTASAGTPPSVAFSASSAAPLGRTWTSVPGWRTAHELPSAYLRRIQSATRSRLHSQHTACFGHFVEFTALQTAQRHSGGRERPFHSSMPRSGTPAVIEAASSGPSSSARGFFASFPTEAASMAARCRQVGKRPAFLGSSCS